MGRTAITIAGGGIAGLTAALAFARKGRATNVFEQADELREVGAGLQLSPNATRILSALELDDALEPFMHRPPQIALRDGTTLRDIATIPAGPFAQRRWGAPYAVIHRADLQRVLIDAVRAEPLCTLTLGSRIGRENAASDAGEMLVIADGVWSELRRRVMQAAPSFSGQIAWRFLLASAEARAFVDPAALTAFLGPGGHIVSYPVKGGAEISMVAVARGRDTGRTWAEAGGESERQAMLDRFGRWHPALRRVLRETAKMTRWPLYELADGPYHDGGTTVLIGDAAHAMTPFAAQGAAMAIEDAWELAVAVGAAEQPSPARLAAWAAERRKRVNRVRQRTAFNRFAYHARGPVRLGRDLVLAIRRPEDLAGDLDWLYGWRATGL